MIVSEAVLIGVFGGMLSHLGRVLPADGLNALAMTHASWAPGSRSSRMLKSDRSKILCTSGRCWGCSSGWSGPLLPSWNARKVKVSEVFAQVA